MYSLKDKTVLITGATDGLGKEVATRAAKAGAYVILHGRNAEKGAQLLDTLKAATNSEDIVYYNADFSSLQQVKELSTRVLQHGRLDVLINNAAIGGGPKDTAKRSLSADGVELRFAVNYLSHFLLTQNLLPLLIQSAPARIVHVASIGQAPIDFSDVMMERKYDSYTAYCKSKLAQIMYGFDGAEQLKENNVTVNSVHPASLMDTNMVNDFFGRVATTVDEGADVMDHVALSNATAGVTGTYFNQMKPGKANAQAYDAEARKKLRQLSEALTKDFLL